MKLFFIIILFIVGACALPKQPVLTNKESEYFKYLKSQCNCEIRREVNVYVRKDFRKYPNEEGYYHIIFKNLPCQALLAKDSLAKVAKSVAVNLKNEVIDSNFIYLYERITVNFTCYPSIDAPKTLYFDFKPNELN